MGFSSKQDYTHVVIGIIKNKYFEVLVSRRKEKSHLPGLLEFPGGKIESDESVCSALKRELKEELGIKVLKAKKIIQIPYHYSDRSVLLDVFDIQEYHGKPAGNEKQDLSWQSISSLNDADFPAANFGIIRALKLPKVFAVTPEYSEVTSFLESFENTISKEDIQIIQLRSHEIKNSEYFNLAKQCETLCKKYKTKLILNREHERIDGINYSGIHLTSKHLLRQKERPLGIKYIVGASCHNAEEVMKANKLQLDYIFLGPVLQKAEYENFRCLGWDEFATLSRMSLSPTYAIGGVDRHMLDICSKSGGQGIAAIRALWT